MIFFFPKLCSGKKYGRAGQATDDSIMRSYSLHYPHLGPQTHTQNM